MGLEKNSLNHVLKIFLIKILQGNPENSGTTLWQHLSLFDVI